jgi:hypothetical protein
LIDSRPMLVSFPYTSLLKQLYTDDMTFRDPKMKINNMLMKVK